MIVTEPIVYILLYSPCNKVGGSLPSRSLQMTFEKRVGNRGKREGTKKMTRRELAVPSVWALVLVIRGEFRRCV